MFYYSTRNAALRCSAAQAIAEGLAPDGGLFVPETIPAVTVEELRTLCGMNYKQRAVNIMARYLADFTADELEYYAEHAYGKQFDCPEAAPIRFTDDKTAFLELWHGPTCAFKDMALQILPYLLTGSLKKNGEKREVCILVATSGDTGKAALEGFCDVPGTKIFVFYPKDGVSEVQQLQMTTQKGENVGVCAVVGNFDDAQSGVKKIFSDRAFAEALTEKGYFLSSANSINWGRLLPQIAYYFSAYCDFVNSGKLALGEKLTFCVPTGNFGDILAGWYAAQMGLPVAKLVCASNENDVLTDFFHTGTYNRNRPFHTTISPSMDILISSNLERLLSAYLPDGDVAGLMKSLSENGKYTIPETVFSKLGDMFSAGCCDDALTKAEIRKYYEQHGYLIDTHTAVAAHVLDEYRKAAGVISPAVVVSTASPFKFAADVVEALGLSPEGDPLTQLSAHTGLPIPAPLSGLRERTVRFTKAVEKQDMPEAVSEFLK